MMGRAVAALVASLVLAAGAATAPAAADPSAAACDGVRVVVDYNELGGGTRTDCVPPGTAGEAFDEAGFTLGYVPQLQDFVCRVTGVPDDGPCTGGDAYWSLWWSDGSAPWTYASLGVSSLEIPAGGAVGFAWHEGAAEAEPPDVALAGGEGCPDGPECDAGEGAPEASDASDGPVAADDGVPWWALTVVAVLVLGGGLVPLLRRRWQG